MVPADTLKLPAPSHLIFVAVSTAHPCIHAQPQVLRNTPTKFAHHFVPAETEKCQQECGIAQMWATLFWVSQIAFSLGCVIIVNTAISGCAKNCHRMRDLSMHGIHVMLETFYCTCKTWCSAFWRTCISLTLHSSTWLHRVADISTSGTTALPRLPLCLLGSSRSFLSGFCSSEPTWYVHRLETRQSLIIFCQSWPAYISHNPDNLFIKCDLSNPPSSILNGE